MIVKRGLGRQHTTFMPCKNAACSNEGFLRLDKANGIFAAYFKLRGCDTQIYFPVVIVSIRHDLPSDMSSIFFDLF